MTGCVRLFRKFITFRNACSFLHNDLAHMIKMQCLYADIAPRITNAIKQNINVIVSSNLNYLIVVEFWLDVTV